MVMVPGLILRDRRVDGLPVNCSGEDDKGSVPRSDTVSNNQG